MIKYGKLEIENVSNQCVVLCNLGIFKKDKDNCWYIAKGSQEEIGKLIANEVKQLNITRIDDFGGVCKTFLCEGENYKLNPPKTKDNAMIFSFTPKNKCILEGVEMAKVASDSGFNYMILTVQKNDKFGKVWVLSETLKNITDYEITYYEDTSTIVDELRGKIQSHKLCHIIAPGFEDYKSKRADQVLTQMEYQKEVLK